MLSSTLDERVPGSPFLSSFLFTICDVMIASAYPESISILYGFSSRSSHVLVTSAIPRWVSSFELPWPGKCFKEVSTLYLRCCLMNSFAIRLTESSFAEKARPYFAIIGLLGFEARSTTGPKLTLMPRPANVEAVA